MSTADHTLVRYLRNADDTTSTAAITFPDDRDPLRIGKAGYMTSAEIGRAESLGIVLEVVDESDLPPGVDAPSDPDSDDPNSVSADLGERRLEEIAEQEGVDLTGKRSNRAKADAILAARSEQPEGEDSLPATAVVDPNPSA